MTIKLTSISILLLSNNVRLSVAIPILAVLIKY